MFQCNTFNMLAMNCFVCLQLKSRNIVYFENTRFKSTCSPKSEQHLIYVSINCLKKKNTRKDSQMQTPLTTYNIP